MPARRPRQASDANKIRLDAEDIKHWQELKARYSENVAHETLSWTKHGVRLSLGQFVVGILAFLIALSPVQSLDQNQRREFEFIPINIEVPKGSVELQAPAPQALSDRRRPEAALKKPNSRRLAARRVPGAVGRGAGGDGGGDSGGSSGDTGGGDSGTDSGSGGGDAGDTAGSSGNPGSGGGEDGPGCCTGLKLPK